MAISPLVSSLLVFSSLIIACVGDYKLTQGAPEKTLPFAVQGVILCKSGDKSYPIQGAIARVSCIGADEYGRELVPFFIAVSPTDAKGYFLTIINPLILPYKKITKCKAFLHSSPSGSCSFPTDINKGIRGMPLSSYRVFPDKKIELYSVGPFFYTSKPTFY